MATRWQYHTPGFHGFTFVQKQEAYFLFLYYLFQSDNINLTSTSARLPRLGLALEREPRGRVRGMTGMNGGAQPHRRGKGPFTDCIQCR